VRLSCRGLPLAFDHELRPNGGCPPRRLGEARGRIRHFEDSMLLLNEAVPSAIRAELMIEGKPPRYLPIHTCLYARRA